MVKTTGDGFHAVFEVASDGVAAALAGQQAMIGEDWPADTGRLQVRMGLHTGESWERDGDYYGPEVIRDYADGVWLVELTEPDLVDERVAAALNVQEQPGRPIRESLVDYLRRKELLLLLDNVEHLMRECAELARHLLTHCPRLKILVTGREALFIPGEVTLQIPSLSLPVGNREVDVETIRAFDEERAGLASAWPATLGRE